MSLRYPDSRLALDAVDLRLVPQSVTALVGPSGAGKSTLVHLIAGLLNPTEGTVCIDGVDVGSLDDLARAATVALAAHRAGPLTSSRCRSGQLAMA